MTQGTEEPLGEGGGLRAGSETMQRTVATKGLRLRGRGTRLAPPGELEGPT